jgi:hypothetical protein
MEHKINAATAQLMDQLQVLKTKRKRVRFRENLTLRQFSC